MANGLGNFRVWRSKSKVASSVIPFFFKKSGRKEVEWERSNVKIECQERMGLLDRKNEITDKGGNPLQIKWESKSSFCVAIRYFIPGNLFSLEFFLRSWTFLPFLLRCRPLWTVCNPIARSRQPTSRNVWITKWECTPSWLRGHGSATFYAAIRVFFQVREISASLNPPTL